MATHALIVSSSQYWHNYRHAAGALTVYDTMRRLGVPDSQIVLMLAGDIPCDARNAAPGRMVNARADGPNLYRPDIQVDYRGAEVTAESFLRVLSDAVPPGTAASRRLRSTSESRVLIYLTGHGGDEFFKFRDLHEMSSGELADGLAQMLSSRRCKEVLLLIDTCQAASMTHQLGTGHAVVSLSSSQLGQNSFSYVVDPVLGVALSDRFTYHLHRHLMQRSGSARQPPSVGGLLEALTPRLLHSDAALGAFGGRGAAEASQLMLLDYFAQPLQRLVATVTPLSGGGGAVAAAAGAAFGASSSSDDVSVAAWEDAERLAFWGGVPQVVATPGDAPSLGPLAEHGTPPLVLVAVVACGLVALLLLLLQRAGQRGTSAWHQLSHPMSYPGPSASCSRS